MIIYFLIFIFSIHHILILIMKCDLTSNFKIDENHQKCVYLVIREWHNNTPTA